VAVVDGVLSLRSDPFGHPYRLRTGRVVSAGMELQEFAKGVSGADVRLQKLGREQGWPADLEAVVAAGIALPPAPDGAGIEYRDRHLVARMPDAPQAPMAFR
jgi:hypothetical protein